MKLSHTCPSDSGAHGSLDREGFIRRTGGRKGVIMFNVKGWDDATGHFDLWDGGDMVSTST
jgi:hypothetical protein